MSTPSDGIRAAAAEQAMRDALIEAHRRGQQHMMPQLGALLFEIARLNTELKNLQTVSHQEMVLPFVFEFDPRTMSELRRYSISVEPDQVRNIVCYKLDTIAAQPEVPGSSLILSPATRAAIASDVDKKAE